MMWLDASSIPFKKVATYNTVAQHFVLRTWMDRYTMRSYPDTFTTAQELSDRVLGAVGVEVAPNRLTLLHVLAAPPGRFIVVIMWKCRTDAWIWTKGAFFRLPVHAVFT